MPTRTDLQAIKQAYTANFLLLIASTIGSIEHDRLAAMEHGLDKEERRIQRGLHMNTDPCRIRGFRFCDRCTGYFYMATKAQSSTGKMCLPDHAGAIQCDLKVDDNSVMGEDIICTTCERVIGANAGRESKDSREHRDCMLRRLGLWDRNRRPRVKR